MTTYDNGLTPLGVAAIIYIVLALIGLWISYGILRRIIRVFMRVWSKDTIFGSDQKTKLISLGIVALLFPSIFYALGYAIIYFIGNFFVDLPRDLITNWQTTQSICQGYQSDFGFCGVQLGYGFIQAWTSAFSDALNRFGPSYIPYGKLVLMLAIWSVISMFLSSATSEDSSNGSGQVSRFQLWLDGLESATKQNFMFTLVLLVAGYLSIAAITAIPGLEENATPAENMSETQLERQLEDAANLTFDRIPAQISFSDPVATPTPPPSTDTTADDENLPESPSTNDEYTKLQRDNWQSNYSEFLNDVQKQAESSRTAALSQYQASVVARKGAKETVQHFLDIGAWYRAELSDIELQLAACRRATVELDRTQNSLTKSTTQDNSIWFYESQRIQELQRNQSEACQLRVYFDRVPERQGLGSNLGPFGYVASWLLETESLALSQIVGLLGFGLLGSAVSSLVRGKQRRSQRQPLVNELATVVIRGATAAVVVFLAVKGGLAIFTTGESDANSYVLLLTCLVAAVFSEDVWDRAHEWLTNRDKDKDQIPANGADSTSKSTTPAGENASVESQDDQSAQTSASQ